MAPEKRGHIDRPSTDRIAVFDPESGFHALLYHAPRLIGEGGFKKVEGEAWILAIPNAHEIILGTYGTPVQLRPRTQLSFSDMASKFLAFRDEQHAHYQIQNVLFDDSGVFEPNSVLQARTEDNLNVIQEQSFPFAESLDHTLDVLLNVPDEVYGQGNSPDTLHAIKQYLLLHNLAHAAHALDRFHKARYVLSWDGETHMTHGDAGQWHLGNYLTSAHYDVPVGYKMIDFGLVSKADQAAINEECMAFSRQVVNYFALNHNVQMLDPDVFRYVHATSILEPSRLAEFAAEKLRELSRNIHVDPDTASERIRYHYFLAYLYFQIATQSGQGLPRSALKAIDTAIRSTYPDQPTLEMSVLR